MRCPAAACALMIFWAAGCVLNTAGSLTGDLVERDDPGPEADDDMEVRDDGDGPWDPIPDVADPDYSDDEDAAGPPDTFATCPDEISPFDRVRIEFACSRDGCSFMCSLDGGPWNTCTSPMEQTGLSHGEHVFAVKATDGAGRQDETPAECRWAVVPSSLTCGGSHTCAVTAAGGVKCWGANFSGQLGDGSTANRPHPVEVSGLATPIFQVSAGYAHTCAVTEAGNALCWGDNNFGRLGDGSSLSSAVPVEVQLPEGSVSMISAGLNHSCALMMTAGVKCWGQNDYGQIGSDTGTVGLSQLPLDVMNLEVDVRRVAAGGSRTCAVTLDGAVKCWGINTHGELGDGTITSRWWPVDVAGLGSSAVDVSIGLKAINWALGRAGGVVYWADNGTGDFIYTPQSIPTLGAGIETISAGHRHGCALTVSGEARCWGWNESGEIGTDAVAYSFEALAVASLGEDVIAVCAGGAADACAHSCAVTRLGRILCWGCNIQGQLGNGTVESSHFPVDVEGF
jgi:alpha-tubulin suppressor-like RCC1 family protein